MASIYLDGDDVQQKNIRREPSDFSCSYEDLKAADSNLASGMSQ